MVSGSQQPGLISIRQIEMSANFPLPHPPHQGFATGSNSSQHHLCSTQKSSRGISLAPPRTCPYRAVPALDAGEQQQNSAQSPGTEKEPSASQGLLLAVWEACSYSGNMRKPRKGKLWFSLSRRNAEMEHGGLSANPQLQRPLPYCLHGRCSNASVKAGEFPRLWQKPSR
ncbi:hypothetical protein J1605_005807 [Eschrichtius robustus]|uniref:Uncharacterized protein n=1 Tax=Eschrichtius robustus TaxID=9764 RepID=A0AB34H829_ESCRO|nr:hypothetical protein J1605_005807 [Eschrichtius robustus]